MNMLDRKECVLVVIDVQERLVTALDKDVVVKKTTKLTKAAAIMEIPTIVTEQYPKGLGSTVAEVKETLSSSTKIIEKSSFSALKEPKFKQELEAFNKKQVILCGIETHVCVHQTACDLIEAGYEVYVAKDACASRGKYEFKQGIERMQENGAKISCCEIILFEWLKSSKNPYFKEVQALVK